MKIAIDQVVGTVSPRPTSHKGGWAYLWANQLKYYFAQLGEGDIEIKVLHNEESWDGYDLIYLDHGMEFNGESLNLFGGAQDEPALRLGRLLSVDPLSLVSLDRAMPDYGALGKGRLKACSNVWRNTDWDAITAACGKMDFMTQESMAEHIKLDHLALGDSHTFSMYKPGMAVCRNDGQTMFGALKRGLKSFIEPFGPQIKKLTLYFGNIDIRHHLMRQPDPAVALFAMLDEYEKQIKALNMDYVELISALPIESESRKLPKTGFYKGTPFAGTWEERTALVTMFNMRLEEICHHNGWELYSHPNVYKNERGELDFEVMELPQSVHLRRSFYRWDLVNDCPNPNLEPGYEKPVKGAKPVKVKKDETKPAKPKDISSLIVF
jgi:hypothetical protein